jgi:hypothetical protein
MTVIAERRDLRVQGVLWIAILVSTAALFQLGCAGPRTDARDMSASDHRAEAEEARAKADAHRFASSATAPGSAESAARHAYHARQHRAAAEAIERSEEKECRALPSAVRAACPILTFVAGVRDIDRGIRVRFHPAANVEQIVALMRCHLAYVRVRGFDGVPACSRSACAADNHCRT